jgi:hypothetical protein
MALRETPRQRRLFAPDLKPIAIRAVTLPHNGTAPSIAAAETVAPQIPDRARRALRLYGQAGDDGLTDFELQQAMHLGQNSYRSLRGRLVDAGYLQKSTSIERPGPSGKPVTVYVITNDGHEALRTLDVADAPESTGG